MGEFLTPFAKAANEIGKAAAKGGIPRSEDRQEVLLQASGERAIGVAQSKQNAVNLGRAGKRGKVNG